MVTDVGCQKEHTLLPQLFINNRLIRPEVSALQEVAGAIARASNLDVSLGNEDGPQLIMTLNASRAFVLFMEYPGDEGVTARDPGAPNDEEAFRLANGQVDHFPRNMTVPVDAALDALAYFEAELRADPRLTWA